MLRNRLLLCSELTKPKICDSSFILHSSSHASWFHHLDLSLSFCHLFPPHLPPPEFMPSSVSPGSQQHLYWVFVLFCFVVLLLPMLLSSLPSFTSKSPCQRSAFKTEPTSFSVCLFRDSPFSHHLPKAIIPTRHSDTYAH